jgi:diguanylate cyclase (GGDEF)-like protein
MSPAIPRKVVIGLGLGFAILAVNALIAYGTIVSLRGATRSVEDGLRVEELLRSANSAVADSEAGQRSYIINEKKEYLEYSRDALKVAHSGLNEIRALIGTDPADLKTIGSLQTSIAERTAEFDGTLALLLEGNKAAALRAISTEGSRRNLESTYDLFDQIKAKQGELLTRRTRQLQESSYFTLATQNIATVFGLLFLGLIYYLVYREITVRRQTEEQLRIVATHDALTALPNRTLLHERLSHALAKAQRHDRQLAALFVGLDRFKSVNDTLGHEAGDALLQDAARRLYDCLRETDTMARQGGDEFVVLMDELSDREPISRVSQRILDAVARPSPWKGGNCTSAPASESAFTRTTAGPCCETRTSPCTAPRRREETATSSTRRSSTTIPSNGWRWNPACAARWSAASSRCTISRR